MCEDWYDNEAYDYIYEIQEANYNPLRENMEYEFNSQYDYIAELEQEHYDPVADYEHLIHDDMTDEEIEEVIKAAENRRYYRHVVRQERFDY